MEGRNAYFLTVPGRDMAAKKRRYCATCDKIKIQVRTRCSKCGNYMRIVREG